jgi:hypothetical protein
MRALGRALASEERAPPTPIAIVAGASECVRTACSYARGCRCSLTTEEVLMSGNPHRLGTRDEVRAPGWLLRMSASRAAVALLLLVAVACGSSSTSGTPSRDAGADGRREPGAGGVNASGGAGAPPSAGGSGLGGTGAGGRTGHGGSAGSSDAGTGGAGAAASDGGPLPDGAVTAHVECDVDGSAVQGPTQPSMRSRVQGRNGAFEDRCEPNGNLIKYACETAQHCSGPFPNPSCQTYVTGLVRPLLVDCAGGCRDGSCEDRCPGAGEHIV